MKLNAMQKEQVRRDLQAIDKLLAMADTFGKIPNAAQEPVRALRRTIDTLAIAAGVFEPDEVEDHG